MPRGDWLVGGDRREIAAQRIYTAATELIARDGLDAFDIDRLAATVHCSRATVYRYAGGKAEIRDAVLARAAADIIASVRSAVDGLSGSERVITAITVALKRIRCDPLSQVMISSVRGHNAMSWLNTSPMIAGFATDLSGLADGDPQAAQWIVRVVLSLVYWPLEQGNEDEETERLVRRFVAPAFSQTDSATA